MICPQPQHAPALGLAAALLFSLLSCASPEPPFAAATAAGQLEAPPKNEASGLAASRRDSDLLWTHDDSGGSAVLYAVDRHGASRGRLSIRGARNEDWEDLAAFELDGKPWLLIADTGDNDEERSAAYLYLVEEPPSDRLASDQETDAKVAATWLVMYEDGPRDCEAVAADTKERAIYLLTKRDEVPRLYRVAIPPGLASGNLTARFVGLVPHLRETAGAPRLLSAFMGDKLARPCAIDFTSDGTAAAVLTYGGVLWFPRRAGEAWADTLARKPIALPPHGLIQAEALCVTRDGRTIFVASESSRTLLHYTRR